MNVGDDGYSDGSAPLGRPTVMLVLTREIPQSPLSGRERTLGFIQRALSSQFEISHFQLVSAVHGRGAFRILRAVERLIGGAFLHHKTPLQVALFYDEPGFSRLFKAIVDANVVAVYFDTVRTVDWLVATRRRFPNLRLICDFDDLMSLRFTVLLERDLPISLGYLESATPRWLQRLLRRGFVTRRVLAYEANSLQQAEKQAVEAADAVSVVSSADIDRLRLNVGPVLASKTRVIPPGVSFPRASIRTRSCREFVFIGTDALLQNRLTIEFLVGLWVETSPTTPLRVVGKMVNSYRQCEGVSFAGFVRDLNEVYGDDVIALCPSFMEGGIKTKVLEALGQGVIPVGNSLTFEGMGCDPGILAMTTEQIRSFVVNPLPEIDPLRDAASLLRECVHDRYSFGSVSNAWSEMVCGSHLR